MRNRVTRAVERKSNTPNSCFCCVSRVIVGGVCARDPHERCSDGRFAEQPAGNGCWVAIDVFLFFGLVGLWESLKVEPRKLFLLSFLRMIAARA